MHKSGLIGLAYCISVRADILCLIFQLTAFSISFPDSICDISVLSAYTICHDFFAEAAALLGNCKCEFLKAESCAGYREALASGKRYSTCCLIAVIKLYRRVSTAEDIIREPAPEALILRCKLLYALRSLKRSVYKLYIDLNRIGRFVIGYPVICAALLRYFIIEGL